MAFTLGRNYFATRRKALLDLAVYKKRSSSVTRPVPTGRVSRNYCSGFFLDYAGNALFCFYLSKSVNTQLYTFKFIVLIVVIYSIIKENHGYWNS